MSFIKKAVKKVFSFVKRVVKSDVFKWVAVAALVFFTAGVAAGGFAAFTGVSSTGAFFTAVGQTIATGAASIANAVGLKAFAGKAAAHGGAAAIQAGLTTSATSATGAAISAGSQGIISGLTTKAGGTVALSAKAQSAYYAQQIASGAEVIIGRDGTAALLSNVTAGGETVSTLSPLTGTQLEAVQTVMTGAPTAAKIGISEVAWKATSAGFVAMLNSKQLADKKGPTFVAGGLSHGGSKEIGPQPFFAIGGRRPAMSQRQDTVGTESLLAPPEAVGNEGPSQASLLSQSSYSPPPAGGSAAPTQSPGLQAPAPGEAMASPDSLLATQPQAGQQPLEGTMEQQAFGPYARATNILPLGQRKVPEQLQTNGLLGV